MPTKQQVVNSINGITTNGANTARKVREVLTEIVEFADQIPASNPPTVPVNNLVPFTHEGNTSDKNKLVDLKFSFRGIQKQSVNFTFQITFKSSLETARLEFVVPADLFDNLATVIAQNNTLINFSIPLQKNVENNQIFHTLRMGLGISKDKLLLLDFNNPNDRLKPAKGDTIYSSVQFHSPFKNQ